MEKRYGARPESWDQWVDLGIGSDLLPAIANPNAVISPMSKMQALGKTPSWYNSSGQAAVISQWTQMQATPAQIEKWKAHSDYSISVQTRSLGAIDIDVEDKELAQAIRDTVTAFFGACPVRYRDGTGKALIPFRRDFALPKRVLQVENGVIEVLGDGQQFIAEGTHPSGSAYRWNGTALPNMATPSLEKFEELCATIEMCFGTGEWKVARKRREGTGGGDLTVEDEVAAWLLANWESHGTGPAGQVYIDCPFIDGHSPNSAPTSTAYFPAGTDGYAQGHFVCLHASCMGRHDNEYLTATGYALSQFDDLAIAEELVIHGKPVQELSLMRDKQGRIEPSADNLVKLMSHPPSVKKTLAFDDFKAELVWSAYGEAEGAEQWISFTDIDYMGLRIELERRGMKAMGQELLRMAAAMAANENRMDTASIWISRLKWDGIERMESFCSLGWGWEASEYSRAVGRYVWTALAGRVIEPGCQADMTPILVGAQGAGKTSAIKAMAPSEECYVTIPLDDHDTDTSRRLRGKLVIELEELRGLNSRAIEVIKAWLTRTTEGWVPKYREFEATFKRRAICFGTTNDDEFLNDPTGERRFLPGRCGVLDIEWIKANRDQLWAEGAAKFMIDGVDWQDAQSLGQGEHHHYKVTDSWEASVERWLIEPQMSGKAPVEEGYVTVSDVLSGAVGIAVGHQDRGKEMRMVKVLKGLGWTRKKIPVGDRRIWAYVRED